MYNSTMKAQIHQKLETIRRMVSAPDVFEYKEIHINLNLFDLSNEQFLAESSRTLIARAIHKIFTEDEKIPVPYSLAEFIGSMIDPDFIALVRDSQLSMIFGITVEELKAKRDSGLLLCVEKHSRRMYDWDQVRKHFGNSPKPGPKPKR